MAPGPAGDGPSADIHTAAVGEADGRAEDYLVAFVDPVAHLDFGAKVALHGYLADVRDAILDNRHLQTVAVEDDGLGRNAQRRRLRGISSSIEQYISGISCRKTRPAARSC